MQCCIRQPVVAIKANLLGLVEGTDVNIRHELSFAAQPEGLSDAMDKLFIIDFGAKLSDRD
ncbi:hypothetical protein BDS110ZK4_13410 [Bradyrhizobium diazoefficiens]|uniref:Uncharacterized protein n=1 Tax=Bradyrhizobium diazoefficiens TaxID=1355477 RepID=A0A809XDD3_9BRAD|nr:hypothetical protein XF1B_67920 [Bradyrhizobium diazoefficiens]BCE50367.1 hypothetical protein XF4B_67160 [Bradyrhizobium diazoefficiens]BCE93874.1 hypothetical protein XF10B_66720 [Bradyrhizobium diazoefficiens]BCF28812.1 hypothetical protein XF14B_67640 [Bradyrhizobium diazoefficiens]